MEESINQNETVVELAKSPTQNLLKRFSICRLLIAVLLTGMFAVSLNDQLPGGSSLPLFLLTVATYTLINVGFLFIAVAREQRKSTNSLLAAFFIDIVTLSLLTATSGPQSTTLSLLSVIVVAAAGLSLGHRLAMLIAALASLAVITRAVFGVLYQHLQIDTLLSAALLGIVFFIATIVVHQLQGRASRSEALASRQAADIANLQSLNDSIVQRMRTGVIVTDCTGAVKLINSAARLLLGFDEQATGITLPPPLLHTLGQWRSGLEAAMAPFQAYEAGPALQANFASLHDRSEGDVLVFLEDYRQLTQQAQQLKLASLGRLTASIAHEVRNPLGAISHAAQLLLEATALPASDKRFASIIQAQSQRVNQIVENVLMLSRRDTTRPQYINLGDHIRRFAIDFRTNYAPKANIRSETDGNRIEVTFDPSQLDQVLQNLCDNGLRYSAKQTGRQTMMLRASIDPSTELPRLDALDEGPGVDPAEVQHLFEPFFTTESTGTGLGLYLSRELCEANQTQLSYVRHDNGQSCFRMTFSHPQKRWFTQVN